MPRKIFFILFLLAATGAFAQSNDTRMTVYLLPGQGADARLFQCLALENCDTVTLRYPVPFKKETMEQYAHRLVQQIDTTKPFCLVGVSFGGMNAIEMGKFLHPQKIVLISSAKTKKELPVRYRFQKAIPLYALTGGKLLKRMANFARPIVEPDSKAQTPVFKSMINAKDPRFMKRSVKMIVRWKNKTVPPNVVHIHGDNDHTLPFRRIKNVVRVKNGSHMMTLIKADEVSKLVNTALLGFAE